MFDWKLWLLLIICWPALVIWVLASLERRQRERLGE